MSAAAPSSSSSVRYDFAHNDYVVDATATITARPRANASAESTVASLAHTCLDITNACQTLERGAFTDVDRDKLNQLIALATGAKDALTTLQQEPNLASKVRLDLEKAKLNLTTLQRIERTSGLREELRLQLPALTGEREARPPFEAYMRVVDVLERAPITHIVAAMQKDKRERPSTKDVYTQAINALVHFREHIRGLPNIREAHAREIVRIDNFLANVTKTVRLQSAPPLGEVEAIVRPPRDSLSPEGQREMQEQSGSVLQRFGTAVGMQTSIEDMEAALIAFPRIRETLFRDNALLAIQALRNVNGDINLLPPHLKTVVQSLPNIALIRKCATLHTQTTAEIVRTLEAMPAALREQLFQDDTLLPLALLRHIEGDIEALPDSLQALVRMHPELRLLTSVAELQNKPVAAINAALTEHPEFANLLFFYNDELASRLVFEADGAVDALPAAVREALKEQGKTIHSLDIDFRLHNHARDVLLLTQEKCNALFTMCPNLQKIRLVRFALEGEEMPQFERLKRLQELTIGKTLSLQASSFWRWAPMRIAMLTLQERLPLLQLLRFDEVSMDAGGAQGLSNLMTEAGLPLRGIHQASLRGHGENFTAGMVHFFKGQLPFTSAGVDYFNDAYADSLFRSFASMNSLESLHVNLQNISTATLNQASQLPLLARHPNLRELTLTNVSRYWNNPLNAVQQVERLSLTAAGKAFSVDLLDRLSTDLPRLKELTLNAPNIKAVQLRDILRSANNLEKLVVVADPAALPHADLQALRREFRNVQIIAR